jgi:hypothetical protein
MYQLVHYFPALIWELFPPQFLVHRGSMAGMEATWMIDKELLLPKT